MSQPVLIPSDDAIERGLARRAPHRPTGQLLETVMIGVHATNQVSRRGAPLRDPIGGVRRPLLWAALAAVLIVAGALVFSIGGRPQVMPSPRPTLPPPTLPAAVVSPSSRPASSPSASPLTCATQTTSILTGNAMPPANATPMTIQAGILDVGVYLTAPPAPPVLAHNDLWAISAGTAKRIASIVGPDFNVAEVDDLSSDGRTALIRIGVVHGANPGPWC